MILLLFLIGLALGAEGRPDEAKINITVGDHIVEVPQLSCPPGWYKYHGRYYKYIPARQTWADAELHCVSEGGNLVSIHSEDEDSFVRSFIKYFDPAQGYTWIGLSDTQKEGSWMWSDGSAAKFFSWCAGQPDNYGSNEDCVQTNGGTNLKWNDIECSNTYASVCRDTDMILLLFLIGLALGAEGRPDEAKINITVGDHIVEVPQLSCPPGWYKFHGRYYKYIPAHQTWADAELHCVSEGGNLVSIHSEDEDSFVQSFIKYFDPAQGYTWIGLSDTQKEGSWMWSDGSAAKFFSWSVQQPDNAGNTEDCVQTNAGSNLKWNDIECSDTYASVCVSHMP
ncbi:hypothetical protein INR49_025727, partial [Caranx melampygus]